MMAGRGRSPAAGGPARHIPVMLSEVLAALEPRDGEIIVDGTFGAGGYAEAILNAANCKLLAIDRDPQALRLSSLLVEKYPGRLITVLGRYGEMEVIAASEGVEEVDGVTLDLGVSSMQLD
jgi:16S rRNA (cytosine1402-N4)-methyltransferase